MRFSRTSLVRLVLVLALVSVGCAQSPDRFTGVAPKMQEFVDKGEISGIVTLVATKDKLLHLGAVGASDVATGRKMQTDDIFWIASMTKPIAAVCIGILKDEGKLDFDDPVEKYLPEFALNAPTTSPTSRPSRSITLRQVMTHTSGLGEMRQREPHITLAQLSRNLAQQSVLFQPGARWQYSTAGIDILGRIVEVISGMPYDVFLQKRILDPLGMRQTTFWLTPEQEKRFAQNYRLNPQSSKLEPARIAFLYDTALTDRQRPPLGGAGLFSTAEDLMRFYQMMLNNGSFNGKQILKPETVKEMTSKQTGNLRARPGMPWGLGFCVVEDPMALECNNTLSPGSFGHGGAHGTNSWADPTTGIIYIFMIQRAGLQNPDNSPMRIAYQKAVAEALKN